MANSKSSREKRLRKARKTRSRNASEFDALKDGRITLRSVLENPETFSLGTVKIYDVLRRSPHLGPKGAKRILLEAKVWPLDRLIDVSKWDREEVLSCLPPRAR